MSDNFTSDSKSKNEHGGETDASQKEEKEKETLEISSIKELFTFVDTPRCKLYLIIGAASACVSGLLYPMLAIYWSLILRDLTASADSENFMKSIENQVYAMLVIGVISLVSMSAQDSLLVRAATEMSIVLQKKWFDALMYQDVSYHDSHDTVGLSSLISTNTSKYKRGVGRKLGLGIQYITTLIGGFIVAFAFSWKVSLALTGLLPLMGLNAYLILRVTTVQGAKSTESYAQAGNIVFTTATSIRTVLSLNACQIMISKFESATDFILQTARKNLPWVGIGNGALFTFLCVMYVVTTLFGTYIIYDEIRKSGCDPTDTVPGVQTCPVSSADVFGALFGILIGCSGFPQISVSFEAINHARNALYPAITVIKRHAENVKCCTETFIDEENIASPQVTEDQESTNKSIVITRKIINADSNQGLKPNLCKGEIDFNQVSFSYPTRNEIQILEGLSMKIEAGKLVAILGSSGCGKSTIMQLIERFYDPTAGSIKLDGIDLRDLNVKWLREKIGLVSQEPALFARSIRENIEYGYPGSSQEDIEAAAKAANAHDFIMSFPEGYSTIVGDRGVLLSGGQKQRVAIARALLKRPKILLLDEATSALDSENEYEVQRAIDGLVASKERTTIVIAHRLSTIRNADVIAVMNDKKIVEIGTHTQLTQQESSLYNEMIKSQYMKHEKKLEVEPPFTFDDKSHSEKQVEVSSDTNASTFDTNGQLVFRDVSFAYPSRPDRRVLHNVNLTIRKGETIGVVGPSGSGKSSLISLIERFYDPQTGSIYLDGTELRDINVDCLRRQLALVSQEPTLFNDTIEKNISFGCPGATQKDIEEASRKANAHDFISSFPLGYGTSVGEVGTKLSGGQKQRIALARAILRKPKFLLLDEATSALDNKSEILVENALENLMVDNSLTKIIVAHRYSTIRNADRIVVIKSGTIHEVGSHDELMSQDTSYYKYLYGLQTIGDEGKSEYYDGKKVLSEPAESSENVGERCDDENDNVDASKSVDQNEINRARLLAKKDITYLLIGIVGGLLTGSTFPASGVLFAYMIDLLYKPTPFCDGLTETKFGSCDDYFIFKADDMKNLSFNISYAWVATGIATFIGYILLYFGFGYSAERMNKRTRDAAFRSLIRQEVAYFDNQIVGNIASRIEEDAAMIHSFSGEPLRTFFVNISSVFIGIIVCFVYMWPFALLSLALLPFMAFGAEMEMKSFMVEEVIDNVVEDETSPGAISTEAMLNIRTIASLSIETEMSRQYLDSVHKRTVLDFYTLFKRGCTTGLGIFVQCWGMGLMFWFGGWLLQRYPDLWTFLDYNIAMFSLFFSLYGFAVASHGATSGAQAKVAVKRIFSLIDRESKIDPLSENGLIF